MSTTGPLAGATYASDSVLGAVAWTTGSNAAISDNSYATSALLLGQITNYLKVTGFGFTIPPDATITGITVNIERSTTVLNATHDNSLKLCSAGAVVGNDKASANLWPTADATATYGAVTDSWGFSWTPALINDSAFGVELSAVADIAGTAQVDYISITVDWTGSNRSGNTKKYLKVGNGMSRAEEAS